MKVKQFEIWIADLNLQAGTETGKTRPVLIIQTDLLNKAMHPSSIICPITTNIKSKAEILRVHIKKNAANLQDKSDIMIDQKKNLFIISSTIQNVIILSFVPASKSFPIRC